MANHQAADGKEVMISQLNSEFNDDFEFDKLSGEEQRKTAQYEKHRSKTIRRLHVKISDIIPRSLSPITSSREKKNGMNLNLSDATDPETEVLNDGIMNT